jgi:hypothetical protein
MVHWSVGWSVSGTARQRSISFVGYFSDSGWKLPPSRRVPAAGHKRGKSFRSGTNAKLITKRGLHVQYIDITGLKVFFTVTI